MTKWLNSEGKNVPLSELDNNFVLSMLDKLYVLAVLKRESYINLLEAQKGSYFTRQANVIKLDRDWRVYVEEAFHDLEYEAAQRRLNWKPKPITDERRFHMLPKGDIERYIIGALKDSIQSHGPITKNLISSAAKRLTGAIKNWVHDRQKEGK